MKNTTLSVIIFCLISHLGISQVLFCEDFDNLTTGLLSTGPINNLNIGQNNWYVMTYNASTEVVIVPEPVKGNVVHIKPSALAQNGDYVHALFEKRGIHKLWENRNNGNDILYLKFQYYFEADNARRFFTSNTGLRGIPDNDPNQISNDQPFFEIRNISTELSNGIYYYVRKNNVNKIQSLLVSNKPVINQWVDVELFVDYNTGYSYLYIPTINFIKYDNVYYSLNDFNVPMQFWGYHSQKIFSSISATGAKYDNICVTAIATLPTYLNTDEFLANKFNLYPNPANNVVNITNSENISVKQVQVYDLSGKLVSTQDYNNQAEIQLNIENLASGTYLLHLHTNKGVVVKKLIKK